jgi:hypothetical protein
VVGRVGGSEDLGLVDKVDADGLQDLGLDKVAYPRLGHDGDGDGLDDFLCTVRPQYVLQTHGRRRTLIIAGSDMRATPPWALMSLGTRSRACTETRLDTIGCQKLALAHHDSASAGFLGDASLLGVDDVHDDTAL